MLAALLAGGAARLLTLVAGLACIAFAVYGLITQDGRGDKFAFNGWDGLLYLVAGALLLFASILSHQRQDNSAGNADPRFRVGARVAPHSSK